MKMLMKLLNLEKQQLGKKLKEKHFVNGIYTITDEEFNNELNKYIIFYKISFYKN